MSAEVFIYRYTGPASAVSATRIDTGNAGTTRASTSDDPAPGNDHPIPIPATGASKKRSFWVVTGLHANSSPDTTINNIAWFTSGMNPWTGISMEVGTSPDYSQATGTESASGDTLSNVNYTGGTLAPGTPPENNAFTHHALAPLTVDGSIDNPSTGAFGDYVVYQLSVSSMASQGVLHPLTVYWTYDET